MANVKFAAVRGMNDLLPAQSPIWEWFEARAMDWLRSYGYQQIRTPVLEHTDLFVRGIGEVTDIVEREMYSFEDRANKERLTLRPEFTAGTVRAAIEHSLTYDVRARVSRVHFSAQRPSADDSAVSSVNVEALGFAGPDSRRAILMLARLWKFRITSARGNQLSWACEDARARALVTYFKNTNTRSIPIQCADWVPIRYGS